MLKALAVIILFPTFSFGQAATPARLSSEAKSPTKQSEISDSKELIPIKVQRAEFPLAAREDVLQGQVLIRMFVSETGDVTRVEVVSGHPILAQSAVNAARKWKFKPFVRNGKAVPVNTVVPFDFAFRENVNQTSSIRSSHLGPASDGKPLSLEKDLIAGELIYTVKPVYPREAKRKGIQGNVVLSAVIGKDGTVQKLNAVTGPRELIDAAIAAVQQWKYKPYMLKGEPVEVDTTITVKFSL
jgi:TonB family protein